ncbi:hypothetical protein ACJIZ3_024034 [Penstemon smallii]|uniref:RING-type E3 ubiquitin transferase n=1 Tax=Penstemon smallii TaxID=265156 RepID=A0ABD3TT67_9LAMI
MLQIRLSKPASEAGGSTKSVPVDTVTVACPDHLVLADLPVAKSLGSASATATIKNVGRRSRRQLGDRVHFCVQCDFPIAIYGRLSPCEHAFCLDCARSDSLCYLCDERVQKIQTIKMMEGIFICAAPHCLKSFLKKTDFESHINETHVDLLHPYKEKEGNESEAMSARKSSASDSTVQAPLRPVFSPSSNVQFHDLEDKSQRPQSREQPPPSRPIMQSRPVPPFPGQVPNHSFEQQPDNNQSQVQNRFPQQTFDPQGGPRQDSVNNPNQVLAPPQYGYAPGTQQFFGASSTSEGGSEQGMFLGFPPPGPGPMNFSQNNYPRPPWNMGLGSVPLEPPMAMNVDSQGRGGFFQGDYAAANKGGMEQRQQSSSLPPPPPPLHPPHSSQQQRGGGRSSYDGNHDAPPGFGWQPERRDSYGGGGQD